MTPKHCDPANCQRRRLINWKQKIQYNLISLFLLSLVMVVVVVVLFVLLICYNHRHHHRDPGQCCKCRFACPCLASQSPKSKLSCWQQQKKRLKFLDTVLVWDHSTFPTSAIVGTHTGLIVSPCPIVSFDGPSMALFHTKTLAEKTFTPRMMR